MLYLLDANVLITAHNSYYPVDLVPQFWTWLRDMGNNGHLKMPLECMEEVKVGNDEDLLCIWIKDAANEAALLLKQAVDQATVARVVAEGYAPDLSDEHIEVIGRDPFILAHAIDSKTDCCIVTTEVSKPSRIRQNRHLPDVCNTFGIRCCDTFKMARALGFRSN